MSRFRPRLTYANVVSSICLFLLLGGGAYAASHLSKNSVGTRQLKNSSVTGPKIKNGSVTADKLALSSLGTVPNAARATNADNAAHATNADQLGGVAASDYAKSQIESVHVVGAPGQPQFENGCEAYGGEFARPGFYKDPLGIVHLVGEFKECTGSNVFVLPAGFRIAEAESFAVAAVVGPDVSVGVRPDGTVGVFGTSGGSFGGVSFRTK